MIRNFVVWYIGFDLESLNEIERINFIFKKICLKLIDR